MISLGQNIKDNRKKQKMTQEELAERLNVSISAISKWERGASEPELLYLVAMAEIFHISVDSLIGFEMDKIGAGEIVKQIKACKKEKNLKKAEEFVREGLLRFPNHFEIVYNAAEIYALINLECKGKKYLEKAIELYDHAIALLSQNNDPQINEMSIKDQIARVLCQAGDVDAGIELLKENNFSGHNDLFLGWILTTEKKDLEEGARLLSESFIIRSAEMLQCGLGFCNIFMLQKEWEKVIRVCNWMVEYIQILKEDHEKNCFMDKEAAACKVISALASSFLAEREDFYRYMEEAYEIAEKFDENPVYNTSNLLFRKNDLGVVYDNIGSTAAEIVENVINQFLEEEPEAKEVQELKEVWRKLKNEQKENKNSDQ